MITERTYSKDSYSNVRMFTGKEIEHTPAHGMQTLFVVGLMPFDAIISTAKQHNCEHIYFGANMSYVPPMADKTNLLVMNAGNYRFIDFVKVGVPLTIIMWLTLSWLLAFWYVW